jgi:flagellar biosynthesis chaperone FliJ
MQQSDHNTTPQEPQISYWRAVPLGFKVLFSEIHWQILRGLRNWEIRQLQNKLSKEYERLGKLLEKETSVSDQGKTQSEIELCRKQIGFLSSEVEHLQSQLQNLRQEIIHKRQKKWDL